MNAILFRDVVFNVSVDMFGTFFVCALYFFVCCTPSNRLLDGSTNSERKIRLASADLDLLGHVAPICLMGLCSSFEQKTHSNSFLGLSSKSKTS